MVKAPNVEVSKIRLCKDGPTCSRIALGLWRLNEWGMNPTEFLSYIEKSMDLGVTTFDHADIYGDYTCEERFGEALALNPSIRERMQLITKCGIKLVSKNRPEHSIKYYATRK